MENLNTQIKVDQTPYLPGEPVAAYDPTISRDSIVTPEQANSNAFYTAGLSDVNDMESVFNKINTEYAEMGYSDLVKQAEAELKNETEYNNKIIIEGIINDNDVPLEEKRSALQQYVYGYTPEPTLKDKYLEKISTIDLIDKPEGEIIPVQMKLDKAFIANKSIELAENLKTQIEELKTGDPDIVVSSTQQYKILKSFSDLPEGFMNTLDMSDEELGKDDGFLYSVGVNTMQILDALLVNLLPYMNELYVAGVSEPLRGINRDNKALDVFGDLQLTDDEKLKTLKNFGEVREYIRKVYAEEPEKFLGIFNDYKDVGFKGDVVLNIRDFVKTVFRLGGIVDEKAYDEYISQKSITLDTFEWIDELFRDVGGFITPDDPDKAKTYLEIAAFFAYKGAVKGKALAIKTKNRYELKQAGYDKSVADLFEAIDAAEVKPINLEKAQIVKAKEIFDWTNLVEGTPLTGESVPLSTTTKSIGGTKATVKEGSGAPLEPMSVKEVTVRSNTSIVLNADNVEVTSPIYNTIIGNRKVADKLILEGIVDVSGKTAENIGTTRTKLINLALAPAISLLNKPSHVDMHEWMANKTAYENMGEAYFDSPSYLYSQERRAFINDVDGVLDLATAGVELYQRNSDSLFMTTDTGIISSVVFGKTPENLFVKIDDAVEASKVIREKANQQGVEGFKVEIEHVQEGTGAILETFKTKAELDAYPLFKKAVDKPENIQTKLTELRNQQQATRKIILNKAKVAEEADINGVTPAEYLSTVKRNMKFREIEMKTLVDDLATAKALDGQVAQTPNLRVRVTKVEDFFDVAQAATDGFNKPTKRTNLFTRALFANATFSEFLVKFGTINKKLTDDMHAHGLRSQAWTKEKLQDIQKDIAKLDNDGRSDMDKLYKTALTDPQFNKGLYSIEDIKNYTRPNLTTKSAELYQRILAQTKSLNKWNFQAVNLFEIQRLEKEGYRQSFKAEVLNPRTNKLEVVDIVAKDTFALTKETNPNQVFDFASNQSVGNMWRDVNAETSTRRYFDPDGKDTGLKIYRLAYKHYDEVGNVYEYGVFRNQKPNMLPQQVIKSTSGYMPQIMKGSHFVRKYPINLRINGIDRGVDFKKQLDRADGMTDLEYASFTEQRGGYKRAVMMGLSVTNAKRWAESQGLLYNKKHDYYYDNNSIYRIEEAVENSSLDKIEGNTIRENSMNATKHRSTEQIAHADYQDSFASFVMATEANGSRAMMQPYLSEIKVRWLKEYVTDNPKIKIDYVNKSDEASTTGGASISEALFPKQEIQIRPLIPGNKLHEAAAKQARVEFRQIEVLDTGYGLNWIGRGISKTAGWLAEYSEKNTPIKGELSLMEKYIQKVITQPLYRLEAKPSTIQQLPMRATSIAKIQLQIPMWHWFIQTANSWGHLGIASTAGGITPRIFERFAKTGMQSSLIVADIIINQTNMKKNKASIKAGIEWMSQNKNIGKSADGLLDITAKDRALIIRNGMDSGLFFITDHTYARNFWSQGPKKLVSNKFARGLDKGSEAIGRVGFEQGELMGRVNTWMSVRLDWQAKNPGKNWRTPENLQEINVSARKLAGSMDTYGEMSLSRIPVIATFHQFAAFINKSSEAMWNTDATPFTPKQMAGLSAWNLSVYGLRGGMWYGSYQLVKKAIQQIFDDPADVEEALSLIDDKSLLNFMMNTSMDVVNPTYDQAGNLLQSDLEFNMRFSPMGADLPFGGLGAMYEFLFSDSQGLEKFGPSGQLINDIVGDDGIVDMFQAIWSPINADRPMQDKIKASLKVSAKLTGLSSGILRWYTTVTLNDKLSKEGQLAGEGITDAERMFWGYSSVQSEQERKKYEMFELAKNKKEGMKDLAKDTYRAIVATYGNAPTVFELAEAARALKVSLTGGDYLDEHDYREFWKEMLVYQDRSDGTAMENIFQKAVKNFGNSTRPSQSRINILTKLRESLESLGPGDPRYNEILYLETLLRNQRDSISEEDYLKHRKKLNDEGKLY